MKIEINLMYFIKCSWDRFRVFKKYLYNNLDEKHVIPIFMSLCHPYIMTCLKFWIFIYFCINDKIDHSPETKIININA